MHHDTVISFRDSLIILEWSRTIKCIIVLWIEDKFFLSEHQSEFSEGMGVIRNDSECGINKSPEPKAFFGDCLFRTPFHYPYSGPFP